MENPPGYPEKKDSSNKLLVLVKPPFIKLLDRASCLYVSYLEENQSRAQNKPLFKNAYKGSHLESSPFRNN